MKNVFLFSFIVAASLCVASCSKCYKCHNECKTCRKQYADTTLAIMVCSDKLSEQYYADYLDTLTMAGWVCTDTASTHQVKFCDSQSGKNIFDERAAGLICGQ